MFCDLLGSTELSSRLDPEDLREVIAAYHRTVTEIVAGFDGFVAKYMGDGVLVYFGYPRAHEDDAERAVRAGLGLIDAVGRLDVKSVELQARVGIATGLVVVGDLIGEGSAQEQSVVGETPNLAARLQALAEPASVVIAAGTRRLVGDLFEYRDLGAVEVKGIAAPVPASQVLRPSAVASRFEALRGSALTPLVGRDEEIDLLLRRWVRAKAGDGQVVLISGEAGLGKSRITAALEERFHAEPHIRLRYFCSPYFQDSALTRSSTSSAAHRGRGQRPACRDVRRPICRNRSGARRAQETRAPLYGRLLAANLHGVEPGSRLMTIPGAPGGEPARHADQDVSRPPEYTGIAAARQLPTASSYTTPGGHDLYRVLSQSHPEHVFRSLSPSVWLQYGYQLVANSGWFERSCGGCSGLQKS
jgi:class 3 adenylate cyclase